MNTLTRSRSRFRRFAAARFSAEGAAGLHLTCGVLVLVAAAWLFGAIAEQVAGHGPVTLVDVQIANWFHAHATPAITRLMLFITTWNSVAGVLMMTAVTGVVLWRREQRHWLLALVATVPGGDAVNVLMKVSFARARPSFINPIVTLDTFSFPSGHAASAALFYGFLACLLMRHALPIRQRAMIVGAAVLMVVLVGFSRIYLGAHYLTDVLAGAAEGLAWLTICITALTTLQRRRAARG
jgi:undecaprenyl-diphosphatase